MLSFRLVILLCVFRAWRTDPKFGSFVPAFLDTKKIAEDYITSYEKKKLNAEIA